MLINKKLLSLFLKHMDSEELVVMEEACWVISNILTGLSYDKIPTIIHFDQCIECCCNALRKINNKYLAENILSALVICIDVDSEIKSKCIDNQLIEILDTNKIINKESDKYQILYNTLKTEN